MKMQLRAAALLLACLRPVTARYYAVCARGANHCSEGFLFEAEPSDRHEVRCCSDVRVPGWRKRPNCSVWAQSKFGGICHRRKTFAQAQSVCADNNARLCTRAEHEASCTRGSGCGMDGHIIWSSTVVETEAPTGEPTVSPTDPPSAAPTNSPTDSPTENPSGSPTGAPTKSPTDAPTASATDPTSFPTLSPTYGPTITAAPVVAAPLGPIVIDLNEIQMTYTPEDACIGAVGSTAGSSPYQCAQACSYVETCAGFALADGGCVLARENTSNCTTLGPPDGTFFTRSVDMGSLAP